MGHAVALSQLARLNSLSPHTNRHMENWPASKNRKKILFVTSEFSDLIKVGGLGDVSTALPRALSAQHDIRILIPGYREVVESGHNIRIVARLDAHAGLPACDLGRIDFKNGQIVYLLLCPDLYMRDGTPYSDSHGKDWADNHIRFARLGLAAAEFAEAAADADWRPDLVHANDWSAALAPAYIAWRGLDTPSVFTIHNLAHQGLIDFGCGAQLGLPQEAFSMESMEFYGKLSFLKAGIVYASHVTTVSKSYAREITTTEFGCGLEGLLKLKHDQGLLSGIINGIDESWHPVSDPHLVTGFCAHQWHGKQANARYVEKMFGLRESSGPLFAVVSRLVQQKGIDLTLAIAKDIVAAGGRMAIIGRGEPELEAALVELSQRYPGAVGVHIGFNEADARRMFAGSDFLLMPSRFEPCGLSQMYAQRLGSLPIARKTGGLADTIEDGLSGFLFREATAADYRRAVRRALHVFHHPKLLNAMRCRAMAAPLYWRDSVLPYADLYRSLLPQAAAQIPENDAAIHRIKTCAEGTHAGVHA